MYEPGQKRAAKKVANDLGVKPVQPINRQTERAAGRRRRGSDRGGGPRSAVNRAGPALFVALLLASVVTAAAVLHARTPDLALQVTQFTSTVSPQARRPNGAARFGSSSARAIPMPRSRSSGPTWRSVRTLYRGPLVADRPVSFAWNGRTDSGKVANPRHRYRLRVLLPGQDRDMVYPRRIKLVGVGAPVTASALEMVGMLAACGGTAVALCARDRRLRYGAAAVALIAAPALVAGDVWDSARLVDLRAHPVTLAAAVAVAGIAVVAVAALFGRVSWAFPVTLFAVLPLRVPVHLGGETSHLLVPLYLVIAGGARLARLRGAHGRWRSGDRRPPSPSRLGAEPGRVAGRRLALPGARRDARPVRDPVRLLGGRLQRDRERLLLPGAVRGHAGAPRRGALDPPHPGRNPGGGVRGGPDLRRGGIRRVRCSRSAAQPRRPAPVESASSVLPGQLAVLRPERLRPLSGADPRGPGRVPGLVACRAWARRGGDRLRRSCSGGWRSATRSPASPP